MIYDRFTTENCGIFGSSNKIGSSQRRKLKRLGCKTLGTCIRHIRRIDIIPQNQFWGSEYFKPFTSTKTQHRSHHVTSSTSCKCVKVKHASYIYKIDPLRKNRQVCACALLLFMRLRVTVLPFAVNKSLSLKKKTRPASLLWEVTDFTADG